MTFENSAVDRMTHFNLSVAVNAANIIKRIKQYSKITSHEIQK